MKGCITLGSTPWLEKRALSGYKATAFFEGRTFITQLRRNFGKEPLGAKFKVESFPDRSLKQYKTVVCYFGEDIETAREYAFKVKTETPLRWDKRALAEIQARYPQRTMACCVRRVTTVQKARQKEVGRGEAKGLRSRRAEVGIVQSGPRLRRRCGGCGVHWTGQLRPEGSEHG